MKALAVALLGTALIASTAGAQTGRRVSLGFEAGFHNAQSGGFEKKSPGVAFIYRISSGHERHDGWSLEPKGTVGWSKADVTDEGAPVSYTGKFRAIPVLAGGGPSYRHGRTKVGFALIAGPSFNHFTGGPAGGSVDVKNSLLVRPGASLWYDVSSRLGLHLDADYSHNRPSADVSSGGVTTSRKWNADAIDYGAGLAVGIF